MVHWVTSQEFKKKKELMKVDKKVLKLTTQNIKDQTNAASRCTYPWRSNALKTLYFQISYSRNQHLLNAYHAPGIGTL